MLAQSSRKTESKRQSCLLRGKYNKLDLNISKSSHELRACQRIIQYASEIPKAYIKTSQGLRLHQLYIALTTGKKKVLWPKTTGV